MLCRYQVHRGVMITRQLRQQQVPRRFYASTSPSPASSNANNAESKAGNNSKEAEELLTTGNLPDLTNHYTIFPKTIPARAPPPASPFDIPLPELRREFLALQSLVHPDKFPPGPAKDRAEALSARINEAYRTLADPLLRAQYLLREWHGIDVTAEDASQRHALDPETLMAVMEVQEAVEEAGSGPEAEAEATVARLKEENEARIAETVRAIGEAFDRGDVEAARKECVRLRFWYSVAEGLREWEPGRTEIRLVH